MNGRTLLFPIKFSLGLAVCLVTAGSVITTTSEAAFAQAGTVKPLEDLQTKDGADFFTGRSNSQPISMMNIIQNAIIGSPRSMDEFNADQKNNLDSATEQFRKQQADRIRTQQQLQGSPTMTQPGSTAPSN